MKAQKQISRSLASLIVLSSLLAGCAGNHSQVAWSHAMSGDYLFAYDRDTCTQNAGGARSAGFFSCMEALGYYQVDLITGARAASVTPEAAEDEPTAAVVTSAGR